MALPVIRSPQQLSEFMEKWRNKLSPLLKTPVRPNIPYDFRVTGVRGGMKLEWHKVDGADGYEIIRADKNGDFANAATITVDGGDTTVYLDPVEMVGSSLPKISYKIRATSGTAINRHSVKGNTTNPVVNQPLDATDTATTAPVTSYDNTSDTARSAGGGSSFYGGTGGGSGGGGRLDPDSGGVLL